MQAVKLAPWGVQEKKHLHLSLVGFLKPDSSGETGVEALLQDAWVKNASQDKAH